MHSNTLVAILTTSLIGLAVPQAIDPNSIGGSTKATWCTDQKSSCPLLCQQIPGASATPKSNTCDPNSLAYTCICSNGQTPNLSNFSLAIPYYECTTAATNCVNACAQVDTSCQSACRTDHPCGAQKPTRVNTTSSSTMSATSMSGGATGAGSSNTITAGFGGSTSSPTGTSDAARQAQALALGFGRVYGLALVLAAVCGGFTFML